MQDKQQENKIILNPFENFLYKINCYSFGLERNLKYLWIKPNNLKQKDYILRKLNEFFNLNDIETETENNLILIKFKKEIKLLY